MAEAGGSLVNPGSVSPLFRITVVGRTVTLMVHRDRASDLIVERLECSDREAVMLQVESWQAKHSVLFRNIHVFL